MRRLIDPTLRLLLGSEPRLRMPLLRTLTAAGIYAFSLLAQWQAVRLGTADLSLVIWITGSTVIGVGGFYILIRSGLTLRFRGVALIMPQMVFAIISLALVYLINPEVRGMLLMIVALVLVFGAFTLSPRRCREAGWFAVAVFGVTMALAAWRFPRRFEPRVEAFHFAFAAAVLPTLSYLAGELSRMRLDQRRQKRELRDAMERLKLLATRDELTGLPNRRHVQEWIPHELARIRRSGAPLCVALIDLDYFKRINDTLGHDGGDDALRIFARAARAILRESDVLARWGGEEFLLVMPDTHLDHARTELDRLRGHLALASTWAESPNARVTFSAGLTTQIHPQTLENAVQRADAALYLAKRQGRDRVVLAADTMIPARSALAANQQDLVDGGQIDQPFLQCQRLLETHAERHEEVVVPPHRALALVGQVPHAAIQQP